MTGFFSGAQAARFEDIEYGRAGDFSLRMDAQIPPGSGPFPAAIIVHGGGWVRGDRRHTVEPLFRPLSEAGIAWFSINYRLAGDIQGEAHGSAGQNGIPSPLVLTRAVEDVRTAVAFVKEHAAEYQIDPDRVALIGESAGGQLASMAALKPAPHGDVRAVVAFYSPSDLVTLALTSPHIPPSVRRAMEGTPLAELILATLRDVSPISNVHTGGPPFLLLHGTADALVPFEQSEAMCEKVRGVGGSCEVFAVKGAGHGVRYWNTADAAPWKQHMIDWLLPHLAGSEHASHAGGRAAGAGL